MVGLCPTCICEHTEQHHLLRTLPDYQNIQQSYQITEKVIRDYQAIFIKEKEKIVSLKSYSG